MKRIFTFLLLLVPFVENAKILFFIGTATISEKHVFEPIYIKLAENGHKVTLVTNTVSTITHPNVTEIVPISPEEMYGDVMNIAEAQDIFWELVFLDMSEYVEAMEKIYANEEFKNVISQKYDLIFYNSFFGQAFYGLAALNNCPVILLSSLPPANYFTQRLGMHMPLAHIPHPVLAYSDDMTFSERVINFLVDWIVYAQNYYWNFPIMENLYKKHLGYDLPGIEEIEKNHVSLVLMNTHFLTTYHRPLLPDAVEIGGTHCREAVPLPKDLEDLLGKKAAPEGFIFISFGTVLRGSTMPKNFTQTFLNVFSKLKQKVVWKWESEEMDQPLPENVILKKWLPQQDLLGHPNLKLFISHGGLLSTQQSVCHGVPVIFFPCWFDQLTNAMNAANKGAGIHLNLWTFTEKELEDSISKILNEKRFSQQAQLQRQIYKDQMNTPLERAVYWTDYVLKYNGAPHLRSSARNLTTLQQHSVDVIAFILFTLAIGIGLIFYVLKAILKRLIITLGGGKGKEKLQ